MAFIKSEFKKENFFLDHESPDLFVGSRWQERYVVSRWYLAFRWVLALYHTGWLIYLFLNEGGVSSPFAENFYFFIYLTDWSYMMLTLLNIVWAVNVTRALVKYRKEGYVATGMGFGLKFQWTVQNSIFMPAFVVTIIYWVALYAPGEGISPSNAEAHIMNSVFVLLDLFVSACPVRLLHVFQPVLYLAIYVLFSVIYYVAGGTTSDGSHYIYSVLDWEKPGYTVAFLAIALVGSLFLHVLVWVIFLVREKLYSCSVRDGTAGEFALN